jgi:hypothetical protein
LFCSETRRSLSTNPPSAHGLAEQDSSGTVVVLLDFVLLVIQLSTVYVAYLCDPLPTSSSAPTVLLSTDSSSDPLLPHANVYDDDENEAASDHMQSWTIRRRRRRKGKGRAGGDAYEAIVDEEAGIGGDVVDLNDDEEEGVVHERTSCECPVAGSSIEEK